VVVGVLGPGAMSDRPLAEVARVTLGSFGARLVAIGALISVYGYLSAKLLGMPRVTFALAEEGDLPAVFAAVSRRFHTPWFSIVFFAAAVWGLALGGSFAWNVTMSVVARLFYFGVVCAALISLRRKVRQKPTLKDDKPAGFRLAWGFAWAIAGLLICAALGVQFVTQADWSKSVILGIVVVAALTNWAWAQWRGSGSR